MNKYMILFALCKNRLGIVDEVSTYLFDRNANILDSRMAVMGGQFSITCLFSGSPEDLEKIKTDIGNLTDIGIATSLHEADSPDSMKVEASLPLKLEVLSMDHPGIVHDVVHILKENDICILSLDTELKPMPHTGAPMFDLNIEASVPAKVSISKVKDKLHDIAADMNLDIIFKS
jgi:glycine cleavage system transcriptional repressor